MPQKCYKGMGSPIVPHPCKHCGKPAVDARVELDGTVTYLCADHAPPPAEETRHDKENGRDPSAG